MSATDEVRNELAAAALPAQGRTILELVEQQRPAIERALPPLLGVERFTHTMLTELRRSPDLLDTHPEGLLAAFVLAGRLGLEPGPLGHVYLLPFRRQVEFLIGYRGLILLAHRSGMVRDLAARPVFEGDDFAFEYGLTDKLTHRPALPEHRGAETAYYAVARLTTGGKLLHVAYPSEIEHVAGRSHSYRAGVGPWATDWRTMALKATVQQLAPMLPMPAEWALAAAVEAGETDVTVAVGLDAGEPVPATTPGDDAEPAGAKRKG